MNEQKTENIRISRLLNDGADNSTVVGALLHSFDPDGKITSLVCEKLMRFSKKEQKVRAAVDLTRVKVRPDTGRIYILINRKMVSANSYGQLIDKLYEKFCGYETITLEGMLDEWTKWRTEESGVSEKTVKEDVFIWNSLLKGKPITQKPVKDLEVIDFVKFFRLSTKGRALTKKKFNNMKSVLNSMLYYAVEQGIVDRNKLSEINYKQFTYKTTNTEVRPYTEEERSQMIEYLENGPEDIYTLAILFDFHMVLRIGELKGLKWDDIYGDFILVQRFVNDKNEVVNDTKGHTEEGKRYMPLTPKAKGILGKVKAINPDSSFIFSKEGRPLATVTFNRRLKKCCEALGIEYRSSHKLRFSTASIMYKNGMDDTEIQKLLGHTSLSMTRHYLRNVRTAGETAGKMAAILG